jgi:hypothetical protein
VRASSFVPLLLLLASACGGNSGTTPTVQIGSITLTPASDTLGPNGAVQLDATVKDVSGNVVSSQDLAWSSSDATVATVVSTTGYVTGVKPGTVTITASEGGKSGTAAITVMEGSAIGPSGGTVTALDGTVTLVVPPGALQQTVFIQIVPAQGLAAEPRLVPGTAIDIHPTGTALAPVGVPTTLTIHYSPANLPAGSHEDGLKLHRFLNGFWSSLSGSSIDTAANTVQSPIGQLITFGVLVPGTAASLEVISRKLRDTVSAINVCVNHTYAFLVQPVDVSGNPVDEGSTAQSGNPAVATVKQFANSPMEFFIKGITPGTATVTFTDRAATQPVVTNVIACPKPAVLTLGDQDGNPELYRYQNGAYTRLTNNPATDELGQVSPDGSTIAFQSDRGGGDVKLYLMDANGANVRPLLSSQGFQQDVVWGPDGTWLLGQGPKSSGVGGIYRVNVDGTGATLLTPNLSTEEAFPAISPNGNYIAFQQRDVSGSTPGPWHIEVANADGSSPRQLTNPGTANDVSPAFSPIHPFNPDMVFIRNFTDSPGSWIMRIRFNGTGSAILGGGGFRYRPSFCADGEHVLYGYSPQPTGPIIPVIQDLWIVFADDPTSSVPNFQHESQASYFPQTASAPLTYGCKP